jgi:cell division protein FtsB
MATLDRLAPPTQAPSPSVPVWSPRRAIAAAIILAAAIAALQVFQSSGIANTGQALRQLEQERIDTTARVHALEAEVAALSSLDRAERAARERLGMVPAKEVRYLEVAVPAPAGPLLPSLRPEAGVTEAEAKPETWWRQLLQATPFF